MSKKIKTNCCIVGVIFLFSISPFISTYLSTINLTRKSYDWNSDDLIDTIILFKSEGIDLGIPDENILFKYENLNGVNALIPKDMFDDLKNADFIESIEENFEISLPMDSPIENILLDPLSDELDWGVDEINAEQVWGGAEDATDIGGISPYTGKGVKVAVLDTGIDYGHPDLDDNYKGGFDCGGLFNDYNPRDRIGHGTHVAGIIAAEDNDIGVIGVAPEVDLYAVKIFSDLGLGFVSNLIRGIEWCIAKGIDIISMSVGWDNPTLRMSNLVAAAVNKAFNRGIVLVAGSGNENAENVYLPARLDAVIAVGAMNSDFERSWYSAHGPELDLVAPGDVIYSTTPRYDVAYTSEGLDRNYDYMSGTSMATPMVTGVVALMLEANPSLTPTEVKMILESSALDINTPGWDKYTGSGMVDAAAAVTLALDPGYEPPAPMYVNNIVMYNGVDWLSKYIIHTRVEVGGLSFPEILDIKVTIRLALPSGRSEILSDYTDMFGEVKIVYWNIGLLRIKRGTYTATVLSLEKGGFSYDSSLNLETTESITIL